MGEYRNEARILADGFVKGMAEFRKGLEAIAKALAKQPPFMLQIPEAQKQACKDIYDQGGEWVNNWASGTIDTTGDPTVLRNEAMKDLKIRLHCGYDNIHEPHDWANDGESRACNACPGTSCSVCEVNEPGFEDRYCGKCEDYEPTCVNDHCQTCGAST